MMSYQHVLVATDLYFNSLPIVQQALAIADHHHAKLTIINVVPSIPFHMASGLSSVSDIEEERASEVRRRFDALSKQLGKRDPEPDFIIAHGSAKLEIVQAIKDVGADLLVMGSHGRSGIEHLLGSTASGVLHRATCDVLVVRAQDSWYRKQ